MESPHNFCAVHWEHEPTPDPSQEGNCEDADECLHPYREGWVRFIERFLGLCNRTLGP